MLPILRSDTQSYELLLPANREPQRLDLNSTSEFAMGLYFGRNTFGYELRIPMSSLENSLQLSPGSKISIGLETGQPHLRADAQASRPRSPRGGRDGSIAMSGGPRAGRRPGGRPSHNNSRPRPIDLWIDLDLAANTPVFNSVDDASEALAGLNER